MVLFRICDEYSVNSTGMFSLLLTQGLQRVKAFSAPQAIPSVSRLGIHKELGGDTARTADLN